MPRLERKEARVAVQVDRVLGEVVGKFLFGKVAAGKAADEIEPVDLRQVLFGFRPQPGSEAALRQRLADVVEVVDRTVPLPDIQLS